MGADSSDAGRPLPRGARAAYRSQAFATSSHLRLCWLSRSADLGPRTALLAPPRPGRGGPAQRPAPQPSSLATTTSATPTSRLSACAAIYEQALSLGPEPGTPRGRIPREGLEADDGRLQAQRG